MVVLILHRRTKNGITQTNHNFSFESIKERNIRNFISTTKFKDYLSSLLFRNHSNKNIVKIQMNKKQQNLPNK